MQNNKTELNKSFEDDSQIRVLAFIEVKEGKHDYPSWSQVFPEFLMWAVGK